MRQSSVEPYHWIFYADSKYVAARLLLSKDLIHESILLASHAFELYLKAYIIQKESRFLPKHDLTRLCGIAGHYDDFFLELTQDPNWEKTWETYWNLHRYPEPLNTAERRVQSLIMIWEGQGSTIDQLDSVACRVREAVPIPENTRNTIELLVSGDQNPFFGSSPSASNLDEIRRSFLRGNRFFHLQDTGE